MEAGHHTGFFIVRKVGCVGFCMSMVWRLHPLRHLQPRAPGTLVPGIPELDLDDLLSCVEYSLGELKKGKGEV